MPLTGAERAKRFREKLKQDPEKHDAYKKKLAERVKKCQKKINDLNDVEKELRRKQWRNRKAAQKKKKSEPKPKTEKTETKNLKTYFIVKTTMALCINCNIAIHTNKEYEYNVMDMSPDIVSILQEWIEQEASDGDHICQECFNLLLRELNNRTEGNIGGRQFGHSNVCVGCGVSLNRQTGRRSRPLTRESAEYTYFANLRRLPEDVCVCNACWQRAHRHLQAQREAGAQIPHPASGSSSNVDSLSRSSSDIPEFEQAGNASQNTSFDLNGILAMELEKLRTLRPQKGVTATKRHLAALPKEVPHKVAKQTERVLPDAPERKHTSRFYRRFRMPGALGCVDGTHVAIVRPAEHEERFFNRKGYHSLNVMILCDANLNIMCVDSSYPGSTHDSVIWANHSLHHYLERLHTISGEDIYLLGDSGYPLRSTMMIPMSNPQPNTPEEHYQNLHLSARSTVERCIGVLKARFRQQSPKRKLPRLVPGTPSVLSQRVKTLKAKLAFEDEKVEDYIKDEEVEDHVKDEAVEDYFEDAEVEDYVVVNGELLKVSPSPEPCNVVRSTSAPLASPLPAVKTEESSLGEPCNVVRSTSAPLASPLPAVKTEESSLGGLYEDDDARLDSHQRQLDEASSDSDSSDDDESQPLHNLITDLNSQFDDLDREMELWLARNDEQTDRHLRTIVPTDYLTFDWNNDPNSFRGQREEFTGPSGPTFTITENDRPLDIFKRFFTDELLDLIVLETNRYANQTINKSHNPQSRLGRWTPTDRGEIAIFLAIIMFQGAVPLSWEIDYFRENGYLTFKYFNKLMTFDRYILLTRLLHFSNNDDIPTDMRKDEKMLKKIYPILSYLNTKFSTLYLPSQNIVIDETLLKHGPLGYAQKIRTKAAKVGIKSYELCESSTGYLWSFNIYTGKRTDKQTDGISDEPTRPTDGTIDEPTRQTDKLRPPPTGATSQTVIELARPLFRRGHTLVLDNFYNSPLLARYLKSQGTDCFGTLRVSREFVPEELKRKTKTDFRPGELLQSYCHDLSIVMWRDSNLVSLISTYHGGQVGGKEKNGIYKFKPQVVLDYNNTMGGVDRKDQLLSAHPMERSRGHSWYKKEFRHILNITVLNSLIIFKTKYPQIAQRDFRLQLAESLVEAYKPIQRVKDVEHLPIHRRPTMRGNHYVGVGPKKTRLCTMCHKSRTNYICKQCNVSLCVLICFEAYHSE